MYHFDISSSASALIQVFFLILGETEPENKVYLTPLLAEISLS